MRKAIRKHVLAFTALLGVGSPARAAELYFGVEASSFWTSNVLNSIPATSDFSFRGAPYLRLSEPRGDLTYDLYYRPQYEVFTRYQSLNDWNQFVNGSLAYRIGPNTKLEIAEQFLKSSSATSVIQQLSDQTLQSSTQIQTVFGRQETIQNTASLGFEHNFSPRWLGKLDLSNDWYDPEPKELINTITTVAQGSILYALTRNDRVGGGLGATFQNLQATDLQPKSGTRYYQVFGNWNHQFDSTWEFEIQAGPTLVDPKEAKQQSTVTVPTTQALLFPFNDTVTGSVIDISACPPGANGERIAGNCRVTDPQVFPFGQLFPLAGVADPTSVDTVIVFPSIDRLISQPIVPVLGQADSGGTSITYFASASMTKRWADNLVTSISYRRNAYTSSGVGGASILDTLSALGTWQPSPKWSVTLNGAFTHRSSSSRAATGRVLIVEPAPVLIGAIDAGTLIAVVPMTVARVSAVRQQTGVNKFDVNQYILSLRADHRLTKNVSFFGRSTYLFQKSTVNRLASPTSSYDTYTFELGVKYEFDPFQL